jgi:hypothetical protein
MDMGNQLNFIKRHGKDEKIPSSISKQAQGCSSWNSLLNKEVMSWITRRNLGFFHYPNPLWFLVKWDKVH